MYLNVSGLGGTGVLASVFEDVAGSILGGTFRLYCDGGYDSGSPLDADGAYLWAVDVGHNCSGRSEPLVWNAEEDDVRAAIEGVLPDYTSQGGVI